MALEDDGIDWNHEETLGSIEGGFEVLGWLFYGVFYLIAIVVGTIYYLFNPKV